jgi:hypothetical protein
MLTSLYIKHTSGAMHALEGRRLKKLQAEIRAGRGGAEVATLVASGYEGFLARSGEVHDFEDLAAEFSAGLAAAPARFLARSVANPAMVYCTDGEFHHELQCGPGGHCARLYKTERGAQAVRGGTVTVHPCDERGIERGRGAES